ncbi:MAG: ATP synthase F1 subunit gamma [Balneolaceae bacterium]|nr:ATP synthase F1 subunit gamma [Balneolaceae bacterium]
MANLREIRNRIESVNNTQQITRAMKMVAAAKLRKAQNRIEETRPYAFKMKEVVARLVNNAKGDNVLLRKPEEVRNVLLILVSSDRGLCGAFNNNLFKVVESHIHGPLKDYHKSGNLSLLCIGKKGMKHFKKRGYTLYDQHPGFFDDLSFNVTADVMQDAIGLFESGQFDEVHLAYNEFKSVLVQNRKIEKLLPIEPDSLVDSKESADDLIDYIYEPDPNQILDQLLPLHLNMQLWKAVLDSNAAEQGARMTAMDNATENAEELEQDLRLEYNQARQSAITTEISEIVSGAQALQES